MRQYFGPLAFVVSNFVVWIVTLVRRWPYLNQIPVHDLDVTTSVAVMWARSWWLEGPWTLGFALTYAPLSVETPTLLLRRVYESWPPGLVVPIYLTARVMDLEPSIEMVNWINVVGHGLTSMFLSAAAYVLCRVNGWPRSLSGVVAAAVPFVALMQRGPVYFFSQVYTMDPHVLVYVSAFVFLECCYHYADTPRQRQAITAALLAVGVWGCLVDWLMYFVLAVWIAGRFIGERLGLTARMSFVGRVAAVAAPFLVFGLYLWWRFSLAGSLAQTQGLRAALADLLFKATYRAGLDSGFPVPVRFVDHLWWMHEYYFSSIAPWLVLGATATIVAMALLSLAFKGHLTEQDRRALYVTLVVASLVVVPVYAQMWTFRQHTVIHHFSSAKILMPYAFLPFVIVPLLLGTLARRLLSVRYALAVKGILAVLALCIAVPVAASHEHPYLIGRIDKAQMEMWDTIRRNVYYRDVVFSPTVEAPAFKVEMGVSNKLVHPARDFSDIDRAVRQVCEWFHVVVVFPGEAPDSMWHGRVPSAIVRDGGLTFFRYFEYPGPAIGCR